MTNSVMDRIATEIVRKQVAMCGKKLPMYFVSPEDYGELIEELANHPRYKNRILASKDVDFSNILIMGVPVGVAA